MQSIMLAPKMSTIHNKIEGFNALPNFSLLQLWATLLEDDVVSKDEELAQQLWWGYTWP
jgi:hypothetical protein